MFRRYQKITTWLWASIVAVGTAEAGPIGKQIPIPAKIDANTQNLDLAASSPRLSSARRSSGTKVEKKAVAQVPYTHLLPFGFAQFNRGDNQFGTVLAAGQAGLLLFYFERLGQVRQANTDASDVMRDINLNDARNDPTIINFLNSNEAYALKTQKEAQFALIGFAALYSVGVLDAIFDPFATRAASPAPRRRRAVDRDFGNGAETPANLQMAVKEHIDSVEANSGETEKNSKFGLFVAPTGAQTSIGVSIQKPL